MVVPFSIPYNLLLSQYLQYNAKERIEDTTCKAKEKTEDKSLSSCNKNIPNHLIFLQRKTSLNPYLLATKKHKKHPLYHYKGCPLMKKKNFLLQVPHGTLNQICKNCFYYYKFKDFLIASIFSSAAFSQRV